MNGHGGGQQNRMIASHDGSMGWNITVINITNMRYGTQTATNGNACHPFAHDDDGDSNERTSVLNRMIASHDGSMGWNTTIINVTNMRYGARQYDTIRYRITI